MDLLSSQKSVLSKAGAQAGGKFDALFTASSFAGFVTAEGVVLHRGIDACAERNQARDEGNPAPGRGYCGGYCGENKAASNAVHPASPAHK